MNPGGGSATLTSGPPAGNSTMLNDFQAWSGMTYSSTTEVHIAGPNSYIHGVRIERWVKKNCDRDVIAVHRNSSFQLSFLDGSHKCAAFLKWWTASQIAQDPLVFVLAAEDQTVLEECTTWTEENIKLGHQIVSTQYSRLAVFLEDENEGVHFKLRWADYIIA